MKKIKVFMFILLNISILNVFANNVFAFNYNGYFGEKNKKEEKMKRTTISEKDKKVEKGFTFTVYVKKESGSTVCLLDEVIKHVKLFIKNYLKEEDPFYLNKLFQNYKIYTDSSALNYKIKFYVFGNEKDSNEILNKLRKIFKKELSEKRLVDLLNKEKDFIDKDRYIEYNRKYFRCLRSRLIDFFKTVKNFSKKKNVKELWRIFNVLSNDTAHSANLLSVLTQDKKVREIIKNIKKVLNKIGSFDEDDKDKEKSKKEKKYKFFGQYDEDDFEEFDDEDYYDKDKYFDDEDYYDECDNDDFEKYMNKLYKRCKFLLNMIKQKKYRLYDIFIEMLESFEFGEKIYSVKRETTKIEGVIEKIKE